MLGHLKSKLIFPNLSMLDLSNNQLKEIPININELINLSVLNISGNKGKQQIIKVLNKNYYNFQNYYRCNRTSFTNGFVISIMEP